MTTLTDARTLATTATSGTAATSGLRRLHAVAASMARPIRWALAHAARIAEAGQLGRDAETEIGRWTGARI